MAEAQSYFSPDDPSDELFVLPKDYVKDPLFVPGEECESAGDQAQAAAAAPEPDSSAKQAGQASSG